MMSKRILLLRQTGRAAAAPVRGLRARPASCCD